MKSTLLQELATARDPGKPCSHPESLQVRSWGQFSTYLERRAGLTCFCCEQISWQRYSNQVPKPRSDPLRSHWLLPREDVSSPSLLIHGDV